MHLLKLTIITLLVSDGGCRFKLVDQYGTEITTEHQEGLLLYNGGTVCDDGFDSNAATATCNLMGFKSHSSWSNTTHWPSLQEGYSITIEEVSCASTDWKSCSYNTALNDCVHNEDVFLTCKGCIFKLVDHHDKEITTEYREGMLLYKGGTVCRDGFSNDSATAICKLLGFDTYSSWRSGRLWTSHNYQITLDDVICPSPEWTSCSYNDTHHNCNHGEDVFLGCARECSPGKYRRLESCERCPSNTYKAATGIQTSCTTCPRSTTSTPGSAHCSCVAGKFWSGAKCRSCTENSASPQSALQCFVCPSGSQPLNNNTSCSCVAGQVWKWHNRENQTGGSCTLCPQNTYKSETETSCLGCPEGTTSAAGSAYCFCKVGMYWNETSCHNCPEGSVSVRSALRCTECPFGTSANNTKSSCLCPEGEMWDWSSPSNGSCVYQQTLQINSKKSYSIILASILLAMLCLAIGLLLYCKKKRKKRKPSIEPSVTIVIYDTDGDQVDRFPGERQGTLNTATRLWKGRYNYEQ